MSYKLVSINNRAALIKNKDYFDIETISNGTLSANSLEAIASNTELSSLYQQLDTFTPTGCIDDVNLDPPIQGSKNCFAVGLNYKNHAEESAMEIPPFPMIFTKHTSCIVGPNSNIELKSDIVDYEAELVVVIGKSGKNITKNNAWNHVAGLTVGQDISDRAVQFHATPPQFNLGKSFDTFGPIGPMLVSPDYLEDKDALELECYINDELRQRDNTKDFIFDIPYIISYISEFLTLNTGDIIFTGTPAGVGATQGKLLKDGDTIITSIKGIGSIKNKCVRIEDHSNVGYLPEFLKGKIPANNDS